MIRFRFKHSDVWYSLILVGMVAALSSFIAAIFAIRLAYPGDSWRGWWTTIPPNLMAVPLTASVTSAILGSALWWRVIIRPGRLSVRRGIGVGALTAAIAHPVVWYVALVLAFLTGQQTVVGVQVTNPLQDLISAVFLATFSLIFVGWPTVLIGGIAGGVTASLQALSGCQRRWQAALSG